MDRDWDRVFQQALDQEMNAISDQVFNQTFQNISNHLEHSIRPPRRRAYIERNRKDGHIRLWNDYFSENPTYSPRIFRRRFRMNKPLFIRIVDRLSSEYPFFQLRQDVIGRDGLSTIKKATVAIRIMAYVCAADAVDEYIRIGQNTSRECLENFVERIIHLFGEEYLRKPTPEDLQRLLDIGEARIIPGMLGSIDFMHWEWKNCPTAWKGMYSRASGKPTIVLEAVASQDLWIWHTFFGPPGTLNEINILDRSPVFDDILQGKAPKVRYTVNGNEYRLGYYLTYGINPKWATFIQSISLPQGRKASLFATHREVVRKDVERAFGVLQARFAIIKTHARLWGKEKVGNIMRACIILHNMIVEDERDEYNLADISEFTQEQSTRTSQVDYTYYAHMTSTLPEMMSNRMRLRDNAIHHQLKAYLVENIWMKFGTNQE